MTEYITVYAYNAPSVAYAEALASVYPGGVDVKVCYGNSASDSVDGAVKFARAFTGRKNIVVFQNAYHGSTYGSVSMTNWEKERFAKIGPMLPGVFTLPFHALGEYDPNWRMEDLEAEFRAAVDPGSVAAVFIEPVQGDGGMLPADDTFMQHLFALCQKNGILFISEEAQQGFWRTGKCFSIEHYSIVPDGIVIGKSAGGGLPLGAFIARSEIMDVLPVLSHAFTLCGNHLSCAAGKAQLDYMKTERFQKRLSENIDLASGLLRTLQEEHPDTIAFVRQTGLSIGIAIKATNGSTDREMTRKIVQRCYEKGLVLSSLVGHVLRVQPPLNMRKRYMKKGFRILDAVLDESENTR